ncbi:hypothetical protein [Haladaptatus sp. DYF46]|uniref:hypothetical protein n=1 Tax=Haladaptatus sp. DYF46 TaxID=2886041 RepID=UPI001E338210|nr:hypothetical protein [Haladaptatus sp. DYF46]
MVNPATRSSNSTTSSGGGNSGSNSDDGDGGGLAALGSQIAEAGGPRKWVFGRITEFLLGAAVGTTVGIADQINDGITAVTDGLTYAGNETTTAFGSVGTTLTGLASDGFDVLAETADIAGPLGPLVYLGATVLIAALAWRVARALSDSVPVLSGIQTLLEGK